MLKIGKVFIDLLDTDHWYQNHPLKSVFQTEEARLGPGTVPCWDSQHRDTALRLSQTGRLGRGSHRVLQTPVRLPSFFSVLCLSGQWCIWFSAWSRPWRRRVRKALPCVALCTSLSGKKIFARPLIVLLPAPPKIPQSVRNLQTAVPLEPLKTTGPISAHPTAWTCRATRLACSQPIPDYGTEQGFSFCLFNKQGDKSQGLFCKLQRIIQWKKQTAFSQWIVRVR